MYLSVLLLRPRHRPRHRAHTFEIVLGNVLSYFQVLVNFLSNAMDLLKALPTAIIDGKKHGEEIHYSNGDPITVIPFKEGVKHGEEIHYRNGYPITVIPFKEGVKHGEEKRFNHQTSLLITTPFNEGQKHGVAKYFRQQDGLLIKTHGLHEDGLLIKTTTFKDGQVHGESSRWNTKGEVTDVTTYHEGHKISYWCD
jgi:antitoxin component YwqK of YwqJK toxin-antitoxin module